MRGEEYYLEENFLKYLDSPERKNIFSMPDLLTLLKPLIIKANNILDFGAGIGNFSLLAVKLLNDEQSIFVCDSQERMLDVILQQKVKMDIRSDALTIFHHMKTDRPIFPGWIPNFELVWTRECLSTFPNPTLALEALQEFMTEDGHIVIIDWEKKESPVGPDERQKISKERMGFFISEAHFDVIQEIPISEYHYGFLCKINPEYAKNKQISIATLAQRDIVEE